MVNIEKYNDIMIYIYMIRSLQTSKIIFAELNFGRASNSFRKCCRGAGQLVELRRLVAEGRHKQYLTHFMTLDDQGFAGASGPTREVFSSEDLRRFRGSL